MSHTFQSSKVRELTEEVLARVGLRPLDMSYPLYDERNGSSVLDE